MTLLQMYYQNCPNNVRSSQSTGEVMLISIWSWISDINWEGNAPDCCPPAAQWQGHPRHRGQYIIKSVWTMWDLQNLLAKPSWCQFEVEFRVPIKAAMPQIVALLQENDMFTKRTGANALSKLSEQCEVSAWIYLLDHADINLKLSFRHQLERQSHRLLPSSKMMPSTLEMLV